MSYNPEPDSQIRDKFKVVLDLSSYAIKKELDHAIDVDPSDLAVKKLLLWKLKLTSAATILKNLKAKVDNLDAGKLKNVPAGLKKNKGCSR